MDWGAVFGSGALVALFSTALRLAIPTALAAVGECFAERAGVLNLGLEGMMLGGALSSFVGAYYTGSAAVGVLCGIGVGVVLGAVMAFLSVTLKTEQVVNGIAIVLFATGMSAFAYSQLFGGGQKQPQIDPIPSIEIPLLGRIPGVGEVLFRQNALFYISVAVIVALTLVLYRSRFGLALRAVGEKPSAADAAAIGVDRMRWLALLLCGGMAGLGGAVLIIGQLSIYGNNVTAGRGWIAVALVIFGRWNPLLVVGGALLFGFTDALQLRIQAASGGINSSVPYELFQAMPYIVTLVVMVAATVWMRSSAQPSALAIPFRKEATE
jgi:simple sugar transport system permease protein